MTREGSSPREIIERPTVVPGIVGRSARPLVVVFEPRTPDRTLAIRGRGPSPLPYLRDSEARLAAMGASHFGIPCNSAHVFVRQAVTGGAWIPHAVFVDMIETTADAAAARGHRSPGILATTGTIGGGLYQQALERRGMTPIVPTPDEQEALVMEAIYGPDGIKAGFTTGAPERSLAEAGARLAARGADVLILGCTEIPLVLRGDALYAGGRIVDLLDATAELARALSACPGVPGVAGGMGPEATIDLVEKMGAPAEWVGVLRAVFRATVELAGARRDQDHLVMVGATGPSMREASERVSAAGATLLVAPIDAAGPDDEIPSDSSLPLLTGAGAALGELVVRASGRARP